MSCAFMIRTTRPPTRYTMAMKGTSFSVTDAMRDMPPMKMNAPTMTMIRPITHVGMPKAVFMVEAMELA